MLEQKCLHFVPHHICHSRSVVCRAAALNATSVDDRDTSLVTAWTVRVVVAAAVVAETLTMDAGDAKCTNLT